MRLAPVDRHAEAWGGRAALAPPAWLRLAGPRPTTSEALWPRADALEHARAELARLDLQIKELGAPSYSPVARLRMLRILKEVLAADSVFPTFSEDEGGLTAEWRAGSSSIDIEVSATGEPLFTVRASGGRLIYQGASETHLRRHLRNMTSYVTNANPRWRSLFRRRRDS